jgi:hypothetical protein
MTRKSKKDHLRERALSALLRQGSLVAAAQEVGVSERTLSRWLHEPTFQQDYRQARAQAVEVALGLLQRGAGAAISTMLKTMTDVETPRALRFAAARTVAQMAICAYEIEQIEKRLTDLETLQAQGGGRDALLWQA